MNTDRPISKDRQEEIDAINIRSKIAEQMIRSKIKSLGSDVHPNDAGLRVSLEYCLQALSKVPAENKKIDVAIEKIQQARGLNDQKTKGRIGFLEYQQWFNQKHAVKVQQEALRRVGHLRTVSRSKETIKTELDKCRDDIKYWFKNYAWIVDPRNPIVYAFPFELFQYQEEALEWIEEIMYTTRQDGLIDKSRDMGLTWLIVCIFVYHWLFSPKSAQFHALISSYNADEVDVIGLPSTVFEKIRMAIRLVPSWMLPEGFVPKLNLTYMKCTNPETGSSITGATANAETGRSGRYSVIFFDEFSSVEQDVASATAASQSTNTRLFVSTPKGKLNYFAEMRFAGDIDCRSYHWHRHPLKDQRWYEGQRLKMSLEMVAQELDIDYDASQPGKVYPTFNEVYHVITKSEFMREIEGSSVLLDDGTRRFKIPGTWYLGRMHDWGSSDSQGEHANVTYWGAIARTNTKTRTHNIDLSGSVFIFREYLAPPHSTVRSVAKVVHAFQEPDKEQERMITEVMGHAELSERDTYEQEHNLYYKSANTDYNSGIAQIRDYLEIQYFNQPHPFHTPEKNISGKDEQRHPQIKGRPTVYFVVDDSQGECYFDEHSGKYQVRPAKDSNGLARLRAEFPMYHYPKDVNGKAVKKQRPEKRFDDAMDALRYFFITLPPVADLTPGEKIEAALPLAYRQETINKIMVTRPEDLTGIWFARNSFLGENKIKQQVQDSGYKQTRRDRIYQKARSKQ